MTFDLSALPHINPEVVDTIDLLAGFCWEGHLPLSDDEALTTYIAARPTEGYLEERVYVCLSSALGTCDIAIPREAIDGLSAHILPDWQQETAQDAQFELRALYMLDLFLSQGALADTDWDIWISEQPHSEAAAALWFDLQIGDLEFDVPLWITEGDATEMARLLRNSQVMRHSVNGLLLPLAMHLAPLRLDLSEIRAIEPGDVLILGADPSEGMAVSLTLGSRALLSAMVDTEGSCIISETFLEAQQ